MVILILIIGGLFYAGTRKNAQVLVVTVTLARPESDNPSDIIQEIRATHKFVTPGNVPGESPLYRPGITVIVAQNRKEVTSWQSVPVPVDKLYGNYNLTLEVTGKIDLNQPVSVLTRVLDPRGKEITVIAPEIYIT